MAQKNNAVCAICGSPYHMCISCKESMALTPWKMHTCSSEHYKVYQIIHGLSTKKYTKDEARMRFKEVDLSDLETFRPHIKDIVEDVIREDVKVEINNIVSEEKVEESSNDKQDVPEVQTFEKAVKQDAYTKFKKNKEHIK